MPKQTRRQGCADGVPPGADAFPYGTIEIDIVGMQFFRPKPVPVLVPRRSPPELLYELTRRLEPAQRLAYMLVLLPQLGRQGR
ncbi:hypothetical protein [Streptomyces sp. NPDC059611]|uniref:hypothetical protein n=1 Tax=Streptomyces sp. NPDC059611 TaxID=3346884 RepID=UPI00368BA8EB